MPATATPDQRRAFYDVAALGLHSLDARDAGRKRFDDNATARWRAFKGDLIDADRLDLLVRDAAVDQPAAFAPRVVFALTGLAEDDPFGPDWPGADARNAHTLLRPREEPVTATAETVQAALSTWNLTPGAVQGDLAGITHATRVLVAGSGALLAVVQSFEGRGGFDFADQVTFVSDRPGERQSAGLAAALLKSAKPLRILDATEDQAVLKKLEFDRVVTSSDASAPVLRAIATWQRLGVT